MIIYFNGIKYYYTNMQGVQILKVYTSIRRLYCYASFYGF